MVIEKYILDPLSVIVKLAILAKKPIGCKIAINNNIIYIQEVGVFQSLVRYLYNNNKNDIQYLYNPIELACKNYLSKECIKIYPNIKNLFIDAIKGLEKLKETYSHNMIITHTLYLYCSIINNYLGEIFNNNLFIVDDITDKYNLNIRNICFNTWMNTTQSEKSIKKLKSNDNLSINSNTNSNKSNKKQSLSQYEDDDNTSVKSSKKHDKRDKIDKIEKDRDAQQPLTSSRVDKVEKDKDKDRDALHSLTSSRDRDALHSLTSSREEILLKQSDTIQVMCERIKIILNMIDFIDKDTEYDKSVKCLEEFMTIIDQEIKNKIDLINLDFL
jgi:hypothetical protein